MLDRTVRKGDLYELPTGVRIPAATAGLVHEGRIVSVASQIACLTELGYVVREKRKAKESCSTPTASRITG